MIKDRYFKKGYNQNNKSIKLNNLPFDIFKKMVPSSKEFVDKQFLLLKEELTPKELKLNFSHYVQLLHDQIYADFLKIQKTGFNKAFSDDLESGELSFEKFDKFFLSLSQSRKVRSGGVFELIIENLLKFLEYPLDTQKKIDNKKVDFVLPSLDFYKKNPLNTVLLSAKRTTRERWKQVVPEVSQSNQFYLATIDKKITSDQLKEMEKYRVFVINTLQNIDSFSHYKEAANMVSFEHFLDFTLDHQRRTW